MRLLTSNSQDELILTDDLSDEIPRYAILSHTWGKDKDEVTFADIQQGRGQNKAGYAKLRFCSNQARSDGIEHFWVDTCCINKENHVELSEAITSMFRWYQDAVKCYVYLNDVSTALTEDHSSDTKLWHSAIEPGFRKSRWFTRGWTLQELLAPVTVEFYSCEARFLGTKATLALEIHKITTIPLAALTGTSLTQFSVPERMRWTENRWTKKKEDRAYCLLGIFDVFMPLIYGEGDHAFLRLQREINARLNPDKSVHNRGDHDFLGPKLDEIRPLGMCLTLAPLINPGDFVGRTADMHVIGDILRPEEVSVEQRRVVLGGMGGMGKTQLAIAYARQQKCSYSSILWLNATSESTLYASFRSIARGLPITNESMNDKEILARVHERLSQRYNTQWLLILDNHDDPDTFSIDEFLPNCGHGSILITTRLPDMITGTCIRLQPLTSMDDCLDVLQSRSGRDHVKSDTGARLLAERLAGFPLALATAGAYLRRRNITFQQYLDNYERQWQIDPRRQPRLQEYHRDRTLYTTWNLSYDRLTAEDPEAAQVLKLLAYFDNQEIWYELFQAGLSKRSPGWLRAIFANRHHFESIMATLIEYCFLELQHGTQSYSMHSCVHDWTLGELNHDIDRQSYWFAFGCIAASIGRTGANWFSLGEIQFARFNRHGERLAHRRFASSNMPDHGSSKCWRQVTWVGRFLWAQSQPLTAEQILRKALAEYEINLGPDHQATIWTIAEIARLCLDQTRFQEAEQLHNRALAANERRHGPDHFMTSEILQSFVVLYMVQGRHKEAEQMCLRALAANGKLRGPEHYLIHTEGLHNLASLYKKQRKFFLAEQLLKQALANYKQVLGPDDIRIINMVYSLGGLFSSQGRHKAAERQFAQVLASYEKAFGFDDMRAADAALCLGQSYILQGRHADAEQMFTRALAGCERALGLDHESTAIAAKNLAITYEVQGRFDISEEMYCRALAGFTKALGLEHKESRWIAQRLDRLHIKLGKLEGLAESEKVTSPRIVGYESQGDIDGISIFLQDDPMLC